MSVPLVVHHGGFSVTNPTLHWNEASQRWEAVSFTLPEH